MKSETPALIGLIKNIFKHTHAVGSQFALLSGMLIAVRTKPSSKCRYMNIGGMEIPGSGLFSYYQPYRSIMLVLMEGGEDKGEKKAQEVYCFSAVKVKSQTPYSSSAIVCEVPVSVLPTIRISTSCGKLAS